MNSLLRTATAAICGITFVCYAYCVTADKVPGPDDWPNWRGSTHDGIAAPGQHLPVHWGETQKVIWKTPIPGRGHGSPTVVGNHVYLATADENNEIQSVVCFDRSSGKPVWKTDIHEGNFDWKGHKRKSHASGSIACDGERLYISFMNAGAVRTTCLDRSGKQLWQVKICDYVTHQGYGSSPLLYKSLVIVTADNKRSGGGAVAGLDRSTGGIVWKIPRPETPNYVSPVVYHVAGRDQLFLSGCDRVSSFEPMTGRTIWEIPGSTTECVVTMVTDGKRVFTGGGYPKNHTMAIEADGSGKVAWQNSVRMYVPSMIVKDGHLFGTTDAGFAVCWNSATGKEIWKGRLGGDFFASPVLAEGRIYATNVRGNTFVFEADPKKFVLLAENQLGYESYASPVICGSRIYLRVAKKEGELRQENLYCIGERTAGLGGG